MQVFVRHRHGCRRRVRQPAGKWRAYIAYVMFEFLVVFGALSLNWKNFAKDLKTFCKCLSDDNNHNLSHGITPRWSFIKGHYREFHWQRLNGLTRINVTAELNNKITFDLRNLKGSGMCGVLKGQKTAFKFLNLRINDEGKEMLLFQTDTLFFTCRSIRSPLHNKFVTAGDAKTKDGVESIYSSIKDENQTYSTLFVSTPVAMETNILLSCEERVQLVQVSWLVDGKRRKRYG